MRNPDPRVFLDLRPLELDSTPAGFMAEWLGTLYKGAPDAQNNAAWLRAVADRIPATEQLTARDPAVLYVVGNAAANAALRRAIVRYLLAVEQVTVDALHAQGQRPSVDLAGEVHRLTAPRVGASG